MPTIRIIACSVLLLSFTGSIVWGQGAPLNVDIFAEGGVSFIRNTRQGYINTICFDSVCPLPATFSDAGRLFTGVRLRTGHNAFEGSYSSSPNQALGYNRLNLFSFNYVRYLWLRSGVQPFATIGLGANRFSGTSPYIPSTGFDFMWNYGGGTDIALGRHLALRLELRDYVGGQPSAFYGTSHDLVPSAGIVFRFK